MTSSARPIRALLSRTPSPIVTPNTRLITKIWHPCQKHTLDLRQSASYVSRAERILRKWCVPRCSPGRHSRKHQTPGGIENSLSNTAQQIFRRPADLPA